MLTEQHQKVFRFDPPNCQGYLEKESSPSQPKRSMNTTVDCRKGVKEATITASDTFYCLHHLFDTHILEGVQRGTE